MSKILEALKASAKEFTQKQSAGESQPEERKKTNYELTQEQLADIYFSGSEKIKKSDTPLVIKVIEKQRASSAVPWLLASVSFFLLALSLFTTKRVFVDIQIVDDKHPYFNRQENEPPIPAADKEAASSESSEPATTQTFVLGDKISMQGFLFEGAAKLGSAKDKTSLTLVNSSVAVFARANLHFGAPANLTGSKIVFYAKGTRGGENIALAVKDRGNVQAFTKNKAFPFPNALTTDWQRAEIPLTDAVEAFDPRNVVSLRFEFGSKDTANKAGDTIFVKDLQILPL